MAGIGASGAALAAAVVGFVVLVGSVSFTSWPSSAPRSLPTAVDLGNPGVTLTGIPGLPALSQGVGLLADGNPLERGGDAAALAPGIEGGPIPLVPGAEPPAGGSGDQGGGAGISDDGDDGNGNGNGKKGRTPGEVPGNGQPDPDAGSPGDDHSQGGPPASRRPAGEGSRGRRSGHGGRGHGGERPGGSSGGAQDSPDDGDHDHGHRGRGGAGPTAGSHGGPSQAQGGGNRGPGRGSRGRWGR